jgi:hypothetical protein
MYYLDLINIVIAVLEKITIKFGCLFDGLLSS